MAIPTITPLSEAPSRQETEETFVPKADALLGQLPEMVTEMNTGFQWIEDQGDLIDTARDETYTARDIALDAKAVATGAANWVGDWETATGAGVAGASYTYANLYVYLLKVNLANIQSSEPSFTNTDYQLINEIPFEPSVKPTMVLDFANENFEIYDGFGSGFAEKPLNNIVTHTRASSATGVDPIGRVGTVGTNIPRLVFEEGVAKGYLSEEARTNLLTNSEFPNGLSDAPTRDGSVTLDSINISGSAVNALLIERDSINSYAYKRNYEFEIGKEYVFSVFVEMLDGLAPVFSGSVVSSIENDFTFDAGGVPFNKSNVSVTEVGNVYKVSYTLTATAVTTLCGILKYPSNSPRTFKVTGYDLQVGSFPTSYIKTQASTVTRSADSMVRTLGQEWNPNEGTFVVEFDGTITGGFNFIFAAGSGKSNYIGLAQNPNGALYVEFKIPTSTITTNQVATNVSNRVRVVIAFTRTAMTASFNGKNSLTVSATIDPSTFTTISVGRRFTDNISTSIYKYFKYYPRAFDAITLQRLSRIQ